MNNALIKDKKDTNNILNTAKQIITEEIEKAGYKVETIYLFGSRARGDYQKDSDWDFFVAIDRDIIYKTKRNIIAQIQRQLAMKNKTSNDIIINSKNELKKNNNIGNITYYALKYGVSI